MHAIRILLLRRLVAQPQRGALNGMGGTPCTFQPSQVKGHTSIGSAANGICFAEVAVQPSDLYHHPAHQPPLPPHSQVSAADTGRRLMLSSVLAAAAALAATPAAHAFGSGFPGYDVNLNARKKIKEANAAELQREMKKAAAYRAAMKAKKEAEAAAAAIAAAPAAQ